MGMKLLHIIDSLERGGAETLLLNTVKGFEKYYPDIEQSVLTLYDRGVLKTSLGPNVSYYSLNLNTRNIFIGIRSLKRYVKEKGIHIVHCHLLHSTLIARIAVGGTVGLVTTYHSVFYDRSMVSYARKERIIDKITYRKRYFTIFVSNAVKENIIKNVNVKSNYKVLLNFASPDFSYKYSLIERQELKIIMVGNLHEIKNQAFAITALATIKNTQVSIDIYGEGSLRDELQNMITSTGANVTLKGALEMTSDILSTYDLYLMTSLHEGMPISLLEALQTGMPVLLNDIPMLKETAGIAGVFYERNNLSSLIEKINLIYEDRDLLKNMSENSLRQSRKYSAKKYVAELYSIYHELNLNTK